jgi:hypothetical protein
MSSRAFGSGERTGILREELREKLEIFSRILFQKQRFFFGYRINWMMFFNHHFRCRRKHAWRRSEVSDMRLARESGCFVRKVFWLAAIGFGVLFLSGPVIGIVCMVLAIVLGIASMLSPFVVVGLIVWLPFRALFRGKDVSWSDVHHQAGFVWRSSFVVPVRTANGICRGAVTRFQGAGERIKIGARSLGAFFVEVICGAAVGALFGLMASSFDYPRTDYLIYAGSAGAVLGIGVGLSRFRAWQGELADS